MSQPSMSEALRGVVRRDLLLAMRHRADVAMSVFFVVIVASLFPLGVGPELAVLRMIGPGVLWVTALLACLLSLGRLFTADYLDGVATSYLTQRLQSHLNNGGMVVVATHQEIALPTDSVQHLRLTR